MIKNYSNFESIGKSLKDIRLELGLTQKQMSADIISPSYYSKIENDQHEIDAKTLFQILAAHNINIPSFIRRLSEKEIPEGNYIYSFMTQSIDATTSNDLTKIDELIKEAVINKDKLPDTILIRLYSIRAGILGNNDGVPKDIKQQATKILLRNKWGDGGEYFNQLKTYMYLLDTDEVYLLITIAAHKFKESIRQNKVVYWDIIEFQSIVNNFCFLCARKHENKKYVIELVNFLKDELPSGMFYMGGKLLGTYYEALFNHDRKKAKMIKKVLIDSNAVDDWLNSSIYSIDEWIDDDIKLNKE